MHPNIHAIVWDYDGVLNQTVDDSGFLWDRSIEKDLNIDRIEFGSYLFSHNWRSVLLGKTCINELIENYLQSRKLNLIAKDVLEYWFTHDISPKSLPNQILEIAADKGVMNILGINTEMHRLHHICETLGYGNKMDAIVASCTIGIGKPQREFFEYCAAVAGTNSENILLIDDSQKNAAVARSMGWQAYVVSPETVNGLPEFVGL